MAKVDRKTYEQKLKRAHAAKKNPRKAAKAPSKKTRAKVKVVAKSFKRKKPAPKVRRKNPAQKKRTLQEILHSEVSAAAQRLGDATKDQNPERMQALLSYGQGMVSFALTIKAIDTATASKYLLMLKQAAGL